MSFRVPNQPRQPGTERARQQFFGTDTSTSSTPAGFREGVAQVADHATARLFGTVANIRGADTGHQLEVIVAEVCGTADALAAVHDHLVQRDVQRPFRVVLMGRTMAGKSTLFEYFSQGTGSRIGVGAQRTTRDTSVQEVAELPGVEIVDTPGVGAMDGQADYDTAFAEVADADLILWVATDQATQEQTGRALRRLADLGKPILVVLNCLADIRDEINYCDLLEEPERIFGGDAETNLAPIRRHLATSGGRYLDALSVHAQAAHIAVSGVCPAEAAPLLLERSRVESVVDAIRHQRDATAAARRYVSIADSAKFALLEVSQNVDEVCVRLRMRLAATRGSRDAFDRRARRRIEDADRELKAAFAAAVTARERWVDQVNVDQTDKQINQAWDRELNALQRELDAGAADVAARLEADLKGLALDVEEDWLTIGTDHFRKLGGLGEIWGNRAVKVGGRVASAIGAGWAGLQAGAAIGTLFGGPAGAVIGGTVGSVVGGIVGGIVGTAGSDWLADRLFRNLSQVHQRRRQRARDQLAPILSELSEKTDAARDNLRKTWLSLVDDEDIRQRSSEAAIETVLEDFSCVETDVLEPAVSTIDTELIRQLLRLSNRDRTAASVVRATRWRGAGAAVEFRGEGFTETLLFPMPEDVERVVPTRTDMAPSMSALQIFRTLTDRDVTVHQMTKQKLAVALGSPVTPGIREAWESLAKVHTGAQVRVEESVEGDIA